VLRRRKRRKELRLTRNKRKIDKSHSVFRVFPFFAFAKVVAIALLSLVASVGTISAQTMSLPGKFNVSATGAATYSIPIAVPPGTAGMAPALTLDYNSQSGNGILGIGWSLGGLPSIGRCAQTMAQDGVVGGINYNANDRFCLEGQRLVAINGGSYGADGTEYRTEIDAFTRIISHGTVGNGPAWFEAHTKSGQVMQFGNTPDSQILAQGKSTVRSWAVNKVTDTKGNYFTVTYTNDTTNGQAYPIEIGYTGNAAAGTAPYNSVQFVYATRPDVISAYQAGSIVRTVQRLTDVKTYAGTTFVGDYQLSYQQSAATKNSEIDSIVLCAGTGPCLAATVPAWLTTGIAGTFSGQQQAMGFGGGFGPGCCTGITGDFNGDGKTDFLMVGSSTMYAYLSNGDGTFTSQEQPMGFAGGFGPGCCTAITGDFNGDGKTDFLMVGSSTMYVYLSNGDGTFASQEQPMGFAGGFGPGCCTAIVGDFNGDGKTDFLMVGSSTMYVYLSNGDGTFASQEQPMGFAGGFGPGCCTTITGDFNGDGKTDFIMVGSSTMYAYLSNGDGTFTSQEQPMGFGGGFGPGCCTAIVGDFNGDGKTDFIMVGSPNMYVYLSNGDGTFASQEQPMGFGGGFGPGCCTAIVGDFNGDGTADFIMVGSPNMYVYLSNVHAPDLLSSITTGLGAMTALTYLPLTNNSAYTKDSGANAATYPMVDIDGPFYVVSQVGAGNGIGGSYLSTYGYVGAKADLSGRGFLGFRQMTVTDQQTNIAQTTSYPQSFPFIGLASAQTKTIPSGSGMQTLNQTTNTYQFVNASGGTTVGTPSVSSAPYQVSLSQSVTSSFDLDGSAIPPVTSSYQYDGYGNATQIAVSTPDGATKITTNTYTNDTVNWFLGRLTGATVTSTLP